VASLRAAGPPGRRLVLQCVRVHAAGAARRGAARLPPPPTKEVIEARGAWLAWAAACGGPLCTPSARFESWCRGAHTHQGSPGRIFVIASLYLPAAGLVAPCHHPCAIEVAHMPQRHVPCAMCHPHVHGVSTEHVDLEQQQRKSGMKAIGIEMNTRSRKQEEAERRS
jgi:hypothetical protein